MYYGQYYDAKKKTKMLYDDKLKQKILLSKNYKMSEKNSLGNVWADHRTVQINFSTFSEIILQDGK